MDHADHVALLEKGVPGPGIWADLGSGTGAFTLALADLLGPEGEIYALDKDADALRQQGRAMHARFPRVRVHTLVADLARPFPDLPALDGIVAANVLHFFGDKDGVLGRIRAALKPMGHLLLVEYNVDRGNPWVPYPLSYPTWESLAARHGFAGTRLLETRPSRFLHEIYAALAWRADPGGDD